MKYKTFACPFAVAYSLLAPLLFFVIGFVVGNAKNFVIGLIVGAGLYLLMAVVFALFNHKAFCIVTMDAEGIRNRHIAYRWNEIRYVSWCEAKMFRYRFPNHTTPMICVSEKPVSYSFWDLDNSCIALPKTRKLVK